FLKNKNKNFRLTGIDLSEEMIKLAKKNLPDCDFILQDVTNFNNKDIYDAIILSFCIVHFTNEETENIFKKLNHILKEYGLLYLSYIEGQKSEFIKTGFSEGNELFFNYYQSQYINNLLKINNFEIINEYRQEFPTSGNEKNFEIFVFARKNN
ncbi:MAG TPA: class I SAM-dependent methyltransferase, partial [Spirochaetota bacterium]|nr:class I SAM-dependent methyltransferase [Spirochaetota bacterium]